MIATSDQQIVLWDLETLREKERIPFVPDGLPEVQRNEAPIDVRFDQDGSVVVQFRMGLFVYCSDQQKWIETEAPTPIPSPTTEPIQHNTRRPFSPYHPAATGVLCQVTVHGRDRCQIAVHLFPKPSLR